MEPEIEAYIAAYEAANGRKPIIEKRKGGWYRLNNHASFRKQQLKWMADTLIWQKKQAVLRQMRTNQPSPYAAGRRG